MLQVNGVACITDHEGELYCFSGSMGGELDIYYRPTKFVVSNPHFAPDGFYKECIINGFEKHTGVLMYNDTEWQGLTSLIARYASLMTENVLTVRVADIMLRKMDIIIAGTDKAKKSSEVFLKQLEDGKIASLADSQFMESIRTLPVSNYNGSYLIQFIELQQYLKGSFYNELGLRANYNMKREAIGEGESTLDADSVLPLCENMLACRRKTIALVNQLYNTDISVDYNSAWLENHIDSYLSIYNKIAESVSAMHAEERAADFAQGNVSQFGQPSNTTTNEGVENGQGNNTNEQTDERKADGTDSASKQDLNGTESSKDGASDNGKSVGEDRMLSGDGVGRELEGTGQDEELIELEEVVEKMIDNVYDDVVGQSDVVGQPSDNSSQLGGDSGANENSGEQKLDEVGGDSRASDRQLERSDEGE